MSGIGHNSGDVLNSAAQNQIRSIIERWERLEQERAELNIALQELRAEAKGNGFDTKVLRTVVRIRAMDRAKRQERTAMIELYMHAAGGDMLGDYDEFA